MPCLSKNAVTHWMTIHFFNHPHPHRTGMVAINDDPWMMRLWHPTVLPSFAGKATWLMFVWRCRFFETIFHDLPISADTSCVATLASDMTAALLQRANDRLPAQFPRHPCDVFMLVKAFVSDRELSQDPLCVYPGAQQALVKNAFVRLAKGQAPCILSQRHICLYFCF